MLFHILRRSSRRFLLNVLISIFVHRFVRFFWWRWNAYNISLPIKIFFANELFSFCFYWFPIWKDHLCWVLLSVSRQCPLSHMLAPSWEIWTMIVFVLRLFLAFRPHLMVMFCLNSPLLLVLTVILIKCKEWIGNMMAMCCTRLKWLTSKMISTWTFKELVAWAICNAKMMLVISFFLTNVDLKQFGVAMLFMSFKEILLHSVHLFAGPIIPPLLCQIVLLCTM